MTYWETKARSELGKIMKWDKYSKGKIREKKRNMRKYEMKEDYENESTKKKEEN